MLMDAAGHRAVVEITPEKITVRRGDADSALISTNHQRAQDADSPGRCWRYDLLRRESRQEWRRIDVPALHAMLGHAQQGKMTLQSMVFEPANRVIYLSLGTEAARRGYRRIDLRQYLATSSLTTAH